MRTPELGLLLLVCTACTVGISGSANHSEPVGSLTWPAACLRVPPTDALARNFWALQRTWPELSAGQYGALILFSTCILTWVLLRVQSYGVGVGGSPETTLKIVRRDLVSLSNPSSVLLLAQEAAEASVIFLFAFTCEYFPLFASTERTWNADDFAFYALLFLVLTVASATKVKDATVLNRLQTDEWKGWMQWSLSLSLYTHTHYVCAYIICTHTHINTGSSLCITTARRRPSTT